jgi:hypothetical protein
MKWWRPALMMWAALVAAATAAHAQDAPRLGISMGYPAAIGVHLRVSEGLTIRPEISFTGTSVDQATIETSSWNLGVNVSALFTVHGDDRLRTYVAPRLEYARVSTNTSSDILLVPVSLDSGRNVWGATGLFGARYSLSDRFALFGELGFGFSKTTLSDLDAQQPSIRNWGTRTGVGVVFFP